MAQLVQLEAEIFVAPQLVEEDFAEAAARGFRSVVNNRPDGEAPDQLPTSMAKAAAHRQGLQYRYLPVTQKDLTDDGMVRAFVELIEDLPAPVLLYCRTGTRCTKLWAQGSVHRLGIDEVLKIARTAGYDLTPMRGSLETRLRVAPQRRRFTQAARAPDRHPSSR